MQLSVWLMTSCVGTAAPVTTRRRSNSAARVAGGRERSKVKFKVKQEHSGVSSPRRCCQLKTRGPRFHGLKKKKKAKKSLQHSSSIFSCLLTSVPNYQAASARSQARELCRSDTFRRCTAEWNKMVVVALNGSSKAE